ncbi:NAD-dependent epimerase/dehydratase family protein [Deinococcus aerius]|nr:NAD-dependent epimerase/dehydratase family protein [Deinococcus aerius]
MSTERMLVTGGAGFIGSHVVEAALSEGWEVAALDDLSSGQRENLPAGVKLYEVDVRDAAAVSAAFAEFRPTLVSHQAAQASVSISVREPVLDAEVNILGGLNVLLAARTAGVRRVIFASTGGAIYGEVPQGAAAEDWPARPYSPYATSKLSFEHYLETFRQQFGLDAVSLRYANVYGPRQNPHGEAGVVAIFADHLLAGQPVRVNGMEEAGDDGCVRDYVYVADVARANIAAARGETPRLLNVGTGVGTTTRRLAEGLASDLGVRADVQPAPPRAGDLKRSVLDPARFREVLGEPLGLEEGLRLTAEWARSHR